MSKQPKQQKSIYLPPPNYEKVVEAARSVGFEVKKGPASELGLFITWAAEFAQTAMESGFSIQGWTPLPGQVADRIARRKFAAIAKPESKE